VSPGEPSDPDDAYKYSIPVYQLPGADLLHPSPMP